MNTTTPDPCSAIRELISAGLDGMATAAESRAVDDHLADCADCRAFNEQAAALTRRVRLRASNPDPAFVARVTAEARPARLGRLGWERPVLAWCAIVIAIQSVAPLIFGDADGAPAHVARHVGASSLALACGLLYAAWRPHRAVGLLPFVGALAAATIVAAAVDTLGGNSSALGEASHIAEIVGSVVLWLIAGRPGWNWVSLRLRPRSATEALRSTR